MELHWFSDCLKNQQGHECPSLQNQFAYSTQMFIHKKHFNSSSNHYHEFYSDLLATDVTQVIKIGEKTIKEINESSVMRRSKYCSNLKERQWCLCQYRVCITHCFSTAEQLCQASYSAEFQLHLCGCCSTDTRHRTITEGIIFINVLLHH